MTLHLTLLCHPPTAATRAAAFADDEPLDDQGATAAAALSGKLPRFDRVLSSPARAALQTAAALRLEAETIPQLRDADHGRWRGRPLGDVGAAEPDALALWMSSPEAAPHGGESIAALIARVGLWLDELPFSGRVLAVSHAAILRGAAIHVLQAPAASFWRVDAGPLSSIELSRNERRWALRAVSARRGLSD
ncbi:histidine phosphatase family protein [Rhodopseudomonas palustris]|uniref:Phosphoglycerate mutase n=1 Tax=Rhodopseudomonas palustris (strain BisB18) TaxID=316056 RepID=Q214Y0_RHOPB